MKPRYPRGEAGFTLLDVLISVFILAFGMLALARVMAQSSLSEVEASQRSQAMMLVQDMSERINLNRKNAAAYVGSYGATWGPAEAPSCSALTGVNADVCEWQNLLAGSTTLDGTSAIGAPISARGCRDKSGSQHLRDRGCLAGIGPHDGFRQRLRNRRV